MMNQTLLWICLSAIAFTDCQPESKRSEASDADAVDAFVQDYIQLRWPDAAGERIVRSRLRRMIAAKCVISLTDSARAGDTSVTRTQFLRGLARLRFMVRSIPLLLRPPAVSRRGDTAEVTYGIFRETTKRSEVVDCSLVIGRIDGKIRILRISEDYRTPTQAEIEKSRRLRQQRTYNPRHGLGFRFLGGGSFGGTHPSYSPDGKRIVFTSVRHTSSEIYVMDLVTRQTRRVTRSRYWELDPSFLAKGQEILFWSDEGDNFGAPWIMKDDGTERRRLAPALAHCSKVVVAPSAGTLAVLARVGNRGKRGIWVRRPGDEEFRRISPLQLDCFDVCFATGGRHVAFLWREDGRDAANGIGVCQLDGSKLSRFVLSEEVKHVAALRMGSGEVYWSGTDRSGRRGLWSFAMQEQTTRRIAVGGNGTFEGAVLGPNGRYLYFVSDKDEDYEGEIYSVDLKDGHEARRLTRARGYISDLGVSPDGKQVLFLLGPKYGRTGGRGWICVVGFQGGPVQRLCTNY